MLQMGFPFCCHSPGLGVIEHLPGARHWAPLGGAACEACTITCLNPSPTPGLSPGIKSCTGAKSTSSLCGMEPQKWVNRDPETEDTKGNNFYTLPSLTAVNLPAKAQVSSS